MALMTMRATRSLAWVFLAALGGALVAPRNAGTASPPAALRIVPPGQTKDSPFVTLFPHRLHEEFACYACHPSFAAPGRTLGGHAAFTRGAACGGCHNGTAAFATTDATTCARCHTRMGAP